ncbi:MAG: carbohydrate kinase family protein [Planctomycetota bacterium]
MEVGAPLVTAGGAVANTGLALHRLGVPVRLVARTGDDAFGSLLREVLRAACPEDAVQLQRVAGEITSYSIVLSSAGTDRSFLHCPGANQEFASADVAADQLGTARILHVGYPPLMRRLWQDEGSELVHLFTRARQQGLATSLDFALPDPASPAALAAWDRILARVLPVTDFFLPSIDEMLLLLRRSEYLASPCAPRCSIEIVSGLAEQLLQLGTFAVGLKLGARGMALFTHGPERLQAVGGRISLSPHWASRAILQPGFAPSCVAGTTGAGDAAVAGFLAAIGAGTGPEMAARLACAVGCCSVEQADAVSGVPALAAVAARLERGWPQQLEDRSRQDLPPAGFRWDAAQRCWQREVEPRIAPRS